MNSVVENNHITNIGVKYFGHVGIFASYTDRSLIRHNELDNLLASDISIGWGLECPRDPTVAQFNKIQYNLLRNHLKILRDGRGIYTLGSQPKSAINNNYIL